MADIANTTMTGRLTRDPETTETKTSSVTKFSIAVNGFKKDNVSFFDCEAWGKVGEIVQEYCGKGKQVAISGTIRIDRWEDKDGNNRSKPIVNVRDLTLLGSKDEAKATEPKQEKVEVSSDDLPF
tara:strand:+ start:1123 stop:1497 length:375 start_codon:yes stop_codon:yes gene_type:complete